MLSILEAAGWPIWPLLACSVLGLALVLERFISLRTSRIAPAGLLEEAMLASRLGPPGAEVLRQFEDSSVLGELLASAWRVQQRNPVASETELRSALEAAGRLAAARLHKHLTALGTIASTAPLLGLLGTVVGMIEIFGAQGATSGAGNPVQLAHGISTALYNTAFGLLVAIPALAFWRHFRARADEHLLQLENAAERFAYHLGHACR